jgi:undecaprenyl-diphosphatase
MKKLLSRKSLFITSCALFAAFIYFSYLVAKEKFNRLDFDLTVKLQDKIPHRLDLPFSFFSVMGSAEITGIIWFTLLIIMIVKKFWKAAASLFLLPLALAIEVFGKLFVHHPAPPYLFYRGQLDVNFPLHFTHTDYSYPSGHETRTAFLILFIICYAAYRMGRKAKLIFIPLLVFILAVMTVSRVSLGEHWTTDVIGGFLIGVSFGLMSGLTIPKKSVS